MSGEGRPTLGERVVYAALVVAVALWVFEVWRAFWP